MSTNEFKDVIRQSTQESANTFGWDLTKNAERGYAFQAWVASLILDYEGLDQNVEDVMLLSGDKGTDLIIEDAANRTLHLCQCKYVTPNAPVDLNEVLSFFSKHPLYSDDTWLRRHAGEVSFDLLGGYPERVRDGWRFTYRFFTTGRASDEVLDAVGEHIEAAKAVDTALSCELLSFSELKDYYLQALGLEEPIPAEVSLDLPSDFFFEKQDPYPTIVAVIKGNALRNLYSQHKSSLYAWNIRGYLGNQGINKDIVRTAQGHPEDFFYFNNGVAAICTEFSVESPGLHRHTLRAKNFQVINGAQTISSLWRAGDDSRVDILFRLTRTLNVKTDKGINQDIIRYNNSQNSVKLSDFRSNDDIQLWLEQNLRISRSRGALPAMHYIRKRAVGRRQVKSGSLGLKLEDLAKIRFAYFYNEPELISASPKRLWTLDDDGGVYEKAFGVDGHLESAWSETTLNETYLAIALYTYISDRMVKLGEKDERLKFLRRMRWLALSMGGWYLRHVGDANDLAFHKTEFLSRADRFWDEARRVLIAGHKRAMDDEISLFALVRATDRWEAMMGEFELQVIAQS